MGCAASSSSDVANEKTEEPLVEIERRLSRIEVAALGNEGWLLETRERERERHAQKGRISRGERSFSNTNTLSHTLEIVCIDVSDKLRVHTRSGT